MYSYTIIVDKVDETSEACMGSSFDKRPLYVHLISAVQFESR